MRNVVFVPVWLREYLMERGIGYGELLKDWPEMVTILSRLDVTSYEVAQQVYGNVRSIYNPLHSFVATVTGRTPDSDDRRYFEAWLRSNHPDYLPMLSGAVTESELFYQLMVEGPSVSSTRTFDPKSTRGAEINFEFQLLDDTMVVIPHHQPGFDNRAPRNRADILSKCVEALHLCMRFDAIAATPVFAAYLEATRQENFLVNNDSATELG